MIQIKPFNLRTLLLLSGQRRLRPCVYSIIRQVSAFFSNNKLPMSIKHLFISFISFIVFEQQRSRTLLVFRKIIVLKSTIMRYHLLLNRWRSSGRHVPSQTLKSCSAAQFQTSLNSDKSIMTSFKLLKFILTAPCLCSSCVQEFKNQRYP